MLRRDFGGIKGEMGRVAERMAVYSDESGSQQDRFNSICAVSGHYSDLQELSDKLREILIGFPLRELKFENVGSDKKSTNCCHQFIEVAIESIAQGKIRIDVIIWDNQDSRHSIPGRDDIKNFQIMYYNLLRHIAVQWNHYQWEFYPDELSTPAIFRRVKTIFDSTKHPRREKPGFLKLFEDSTTEFRCIAMQPSKSIKEPLIQLADIFAGFANFSRTKAERFTIEQAYAFNKWQQLKQHQDLNESQIPLFGKQLSSDEIDALLSFVSSEKIKKRFELILWIKQLCEKKNISVNLSKLNYLATFDKRQGLNFWHYTPQGEYDKAPKKKKDK